MEDYSEILPQNNYESNESCDGATDAQLLWFDNLRYWTEGVVQLILGNDHCIYRIFCKLSLTYFPTLAH